MGRKLVKLGARRISVYLSGEANAKLIKLSHGHKSQYIECLILKDWMLNNPDIQIEKELKGVFDGIE